MSAANGRSRISAKEFVAATGVILSLVFVGLEIGQNTLAVRSSTLQALSDSHRDLVLQSLMSEEHSALISRTFLGETSEGFTDHENTQLHGYYVVYISHLHNTYLQRDAGVVDEEVFEAYGWNSPVLRTPHFDEWSERALATVTPAFADFFRQWMAEHVSEFRLR